MSDQYIQCERHGYQAAVETTWTRRDDGAKFTTRDCSICEAEIRADIDAGVQLLGRLERVCAHCRRPMRGHASMNDDWLCHPDHGLDCYRLVTVYGHERPCGRVTCTHAINEGE